VATARTGVGPFRRDPRPYIYAGLNLVLAAVQLYVLVEVTPNRHAWAQALLLALPFATIGLGVAMLFRKPLAWRAAVAFGAVVLLVTIAVLGLLLMSAAFLSGVYGAFGTGAAMGILGAAALIVELVALVPVLQLSYLCSRAGRRVFGLPPLWKPAP
jgi:hypothetical protein